VFRPALRLIAVHLTEIRDVVFAAQCRSSSAAQRLCGGKIPLRRQTGVDHRVAEAGIVMQHRLMTPANRAVITIRASNTSWKLSLRYNADDRGAPQQVQVVIASTVTAWRPVAFTKRSVASESGRMTRSR